jgi:hypothetical protein
MTGGIMRVEECCSWCRRPASRCNDASCDDAKTYSGVLLRGEWKEVEDELKAPEMSAAA